MILKTRTGSGEKQEEIFSEVGNKIPVEIKTKIAQLRPGDQIIIRNITIHTEEFSTLKCERVFNVVE